MLIHIKPEADTQRHARSVRCKCKPTVTKTPAATVVRHNSFDKREQEAKQTKDWIIT